MSALPGRQPFWALCGPFTWRLHRNWSMAARMEGEWPSRERFATRHRQRHPARRRLDFQDIGLVLRADWKRLRPLAATVLLKTDDLCSGVRPALAHCVRAMRAPRFSLLNATVIAICAVSAYAAGFAAHGSLEQSAPGVAAARSASVTNFHTPVARHVVTLPPITVVGVRPPPAPSDVTASDLAPDGKLWRRAARLTGTNPLLLYAVALVETRRNVGLGTVAPDPYVVRINGGVISGGWGQVSDAIARAQSSGAKIQDVGIMQVYYPAHRSMESDPVHLLDPWRNVIVGATILKRCMSTAKSMVAGIGCYHSPNPALALPYGRAVMTVYRRLTGMHDASDRFATEAPVITSAGTPIVGAPDAGGSVK